MENCNCEKKTERSAKEKRALRTRINKIIGQLNGINRMVEENRYCYDILVQLSAADRAVKSLANLIFERHISTCIVDDIKKGESDSAVSQIISLLSLL